MATETSCPRGITKYEVCDSLPECDLCEARAADFQATFIDEVTGGFEWVFACLPCTKTEDVTPVILVLLIGSNLDKVKRFNRQGLGRFIKMRRTMLGIDQRTLADWANVSQTEISNFEHGKITSHRRLQQVLLNL